MKVLPKMFHLNDNTTEFFLQTQTVETKTWPLWPLISFVFYIWGDLLCFDIREQCMEEWENKLKEMEMEGIWETYKRKIILPVDDDDKTNAFVFKLLWKILITELYNVSKHTCNWSFMY